MGVDVLQVWNVAATKVLECMLVRGWINYSEGTRKHRFEENVGLFSLHVIV